MRLIFMGSPEFSVPALDALVDAGHQIVCVYCQPPRPAGRGKSLRPTPVQARAEELGLQIRHPVSLKGQEEQHRFAALGADLAVVVAYGLILPQAVLSAPKYGCVNIHASLLPRWRGAAPIHRAILAGDTETGISIMQMDAGLDTGPVLLRRETPIGEAETTGELHDRLSAMGADLIVAALASIDDLRPEPQAGDGITYAAKIDKAEARIDWSRPAAEVSRLIRGLAPFPGAWTMFRGERIKFLGAVSADGSGMPGDVLDERLTIACGSGSIRVSRAQRAGKAAMSARDVLRGWAIAPGDRLGD